MALIVRRGNRQRAPAMKRELTMTPRTAITQLAKTIGRELEADPRPSESALETGVMLATVGATPELIASLLAESRRNRPDERMINAYAFMLGEALGTLRINANGGNVQADHAIAEVREKLREALTTGIVAPALLMQVARAFAHAELDPGPALQGAVVSGMEAQSATMAIEPEPEDITGHFDSLAAALDNDPFAIHAELAATGAAFPPEHRAAMVSALATSTTAAIREAALGFAFASGSKDEHRSADGPSAARTRTAGRQRDLRAPGPYAPLGFRREAGACRRRNPCLTSKVRARRFLWSGRRSAWCWRLPATAQERKVYSWSQSSGGVSRSPPCS